MRGSLFRAVLLVRQHRSINATLREKNHGKKYEKQKGGKKRRKYFLVGNEKDVVVNMTHRAEGQFQPLFFLYLIRQGREKKEGEKLGKRTERGKKT